MAMLNQSLELGDVLRRALDVVLQLTGIDAGAIFLRQDIIGNLQLVAHRGMSAEAARLAAQYGMLDRDCGGSVELGELVVVPDLSHYHGRRADSLKREGLSTIVHVPLTARGCTLGSMCVGTRAQREFTSATQELLTMIGHQIAVTVENARLYAQVQHKEHMRVQLLNKIITAQEEERRRIARELHDDTSQSLTALLYAAEQALDLDDPAEVRRLLSAMRQLAVGTLDGVHDLIFDLRPTLLDHLGLLPALRWLAQSRLEPGGVRVRIEESSPAVRLPSEVETALFRVVQEAVSNINRHAAARNVHLRFEHDDRSVTLSITDDGIGFDMMELALAPDNGRGLGLLGMQERVQLLGGEVEITSAPGRGTRVSLNVPLPERENGHG
jgi:signal transduction histidine kinase